MHSSDPLVCARVCERPKQHLIVKRNFEQFAIMPSKSSITETYLCWLATHFLAEEA